MLCAEAVGARQRGHRVLASKPPRRRPRHIRGPPCARLDRADRYPARPTAAASGSTFRWGSDRRLRTSAASSSRTRCSPCPRRLRASRAAAVIATAASTPGIAARYSAGRMPSQITSPAASNGPATAPMLSPARSSPKARPYAARGASDASIASRAGERAPREPGRGSKQTRLPHRRCKPDRPGRGGGHQISPGRHAPSPLLIIGERTCNQHRHPHQAVTEALDHPECTCGGPKRDGHEARQDRCRDFVSGVAEEARQPDASHTARQPQAPARSQSRRQARRPRPDPRSRGVDGVGDHDDDEHVEQVQVHVAALDRSDEVGDRPDEPRRRPV